jgi:hypothetical protein
MARTYIAQKTETLGLRVKPEIKAALEKQARQEGVSISALAEAYLDAALRKQGQLR